VRADYLDTLVWDHISGLLADPQLIRAEINNRLASARTTDPATRERQRLTTALTRASAGITNMIQAFCEQLITIDELRARMPDLRARETNLRNQLQALDNQLADREAYLHLAADLEGFLGQLNAKAETSTVPERQRVLRLLVKDVLIGPEKITIRHRIPLRERTSNEPSADTEGEHCQLRWGRENPALRGPGDRSFRGADGGPRPGAVTPEDQQSLIHMTELSTDSADLPGVATVTRFPGLIPISCLTMLEPKDGLSSVVLARPKIGPSGGYLPAVSTDQRTRRQIVLALTSVLVFYFFAALQYLFRTGVWLNNDEADHVRYVEHIVASHSLPTISAANGIESHQAPLYYILAAAWQRMLHIPAFTPPATATGLVRDHLPDHMLWVQELRLFSVFCGGLAVAATFVVAWLLTHRIATAAAAALTLAAWPKFLVVSAAVTNSALVGALCACALAAWLMWYRSRSADWAVTVGAVVGAAVLTQVTAIPVAAVALAGMLAASRSCRAPVLAAAAGVVVTGWWFVRNWALYGDPLATAATDRYLTQVFGPALIRAHPSVAASSLWPSLTQLERSVWYDAGWNQVHEAAWVDRSLTVIALVCVIAALWQRIEQLWVLGAFAAASVAAWVMIVRQTTQTEGRYLLICGGAWAILLVLGSSKLRAGLWLWPAAFTVIDGYVLVHIMR
jgi:hypothetical protein